MSAYAVTLCRWNSTPSTSRSNMTSWLYLKLFPLLPITGKSCVPDRNGALCPSPTTGELSHTCPLVWVNGTEALLGWSLSSIYQDGHVHVHTATSLW